MERDLITQKKAKFGKVQMKTREKKMKEEKEAKIKCIEIIARMKIQKHLNKNQHLK